MRKKIKGFGAILICLLILIYSIYAVVIWSTSKSPDDISKFPQSGVWVCNDENFKITIDLQNLEEGDYPFEKMKVAIEINGREQNLKCLTSGGHGTPIAPVAAGTAIYFRSAELDSDDMDYINFSTRKYKFNEDDFYLLKISVSSGGIKNKVDLHFVRQVENLSY